MSGRDAGIIILWLVSYVLNSHLLLGYFFLLFNSCFSRVASYAPCMQGCSKAGAKQGLSDARTGLLSHLWRCWDEAASPTLDRILISICGFQIQQVRYHPCPCSKEIHGIGECWEHPEQGYGWGDELPFGGTFHSKANKSQWLESIKPEVLSFPKISCQNCKKRRLDVKWVTCTGYMVGAYVRN